jgi:SAM-dependent methyltransferase
MENNRPISDLCPICSSWVAKSRQVVRAGPVATCGACGSWYRVPRPTAQDLARIYDKDYYDSWGLDKDEDVAWISKRATFGPLLRRVKELLATADTSKGGKTRLLDVGAATGMLLRTARELGWEVYATEVNHYSADILRRRYGAERVFEGELTECSFGERFFDVITMTDTIEHVLDVAATLQTAANLLRTGGVLCITTPRIDTLSRVLMGSHWLHFKLEHIQYFSRRGIERSLRKAGFSDMTVSGHRKYLTYDYLSTQLRTYPLWLLTPIVSFAGHLLPQPLRSKPIRYRCGEMLVMARLIREAQS